MRQQYYDELRSFRKLPRNMRKTVRRGFKGMINDILGAVAATLFLALIVLTFVNPNG